MPESVRHVRSHLACEVGGDAHLALEITVADIPPARITESLTITVDGRPVEPVELSGPVGGRVHEVHVTRGRVEIDYSAEVIGAAEPSLVTPAEWLEYLRPSRYVESDRLGAEAFGEFAGLSEPRELLDAVTSWVGSRLEYVPGSSGPTDGAVDTLLSRRGVCRDYAHLVAALLRAREVPARVVAVYAPGLSPMDFHAVVEAAVDDHWYVVDATLLAPRQTLLRIATGRDAADTAFLSNYGGELELLEVGVSAWTDVDLPNDDITELVSLR